MIATSLNPPSEEDDIDGSDEENDEDMDGDDSNGEDNDDDNVMEDDDTLNAELNSKGYIERGIVLSAERCEGAREYFKDNAESREGRHLIDNGFRQMLSVHPSRTTDKRMKQLIEDVKRHMLECFPKKYRSVESVIIKEIQLIMNQKGFDIDQDRHLDSFYDNLVMTVLLQTGHADNQKKGTLTLMSPREYMNIYTLSDALKREHKITQEEWEVMLLATFESITYGLSQEVKSKDTMFSVTEQERKIWVSLLHGNGLSSKEGIAFSEGDMGHARNRDEDRIGEGVLFRSNRSHLGVGNQKDGEGVLEEDLDERLVIYFAFGSEEPANFLQNTSLVIYVEALLDKLSLGAKASRIDKRSVTSAYESAQAAVAACYKYGASITATKSILPVRGDGNCLFRSVRAALLWLLCHIRNTIEPAQYEICNVYKMIVDVVRSEETGYHLLRGYACDALSNELLDTTMPGNTRIQISDYSLLSPRDKLITSLEAISQNIVTDVQITETLVQDVQIVTQDNLIAFIQKMRIDKEYGDMTMLLTLQLMLSHYAVIVKCESVNGILSEEAMATMAVGDPRFVIRLYFYAMPSSRFNECHYDHIMDCNANATGVLHVAHSKKLYYYILIWSRCFWNSNRFVIKDALNSGKGLFANDVFAKGSIVTIYPKGVSYGSLELLPENCDRRHIYIHMGVFCCNSLDVTKYIWDPATATYVPLPQDAGIGLAMFINSSKGAVRRDYNCLFRSVEVWDPTTKSVVEYRCVIARNEISPGDEFIVKYFMEGAEMRERAKQKEDEERLSLNESHSVENVLGRPKKNKEMRSIAIDSAATKHFESCVATLPEKRKRNIQEEKEKDVALKRQRKSTRLVKAKTVAIEANPLGEQKTKKPRGPYRKKERNSKSPDSKAPKQEKTPTQNKLVAEQVDTTPNGESEKDVAKIMADMHSDFEKQKAGMATEFSKETTRIQGEYDIKLANATSAMERHYESQLKIQNLEVKAGHATSMNAMQTQLNTTIAQLRAQVNGNATEIVLLRNQLEPYLQETGNSSILSQIKTQDSLNITDDRLDAALLRTQRFTNQRNQHTSRQYVSGPGFWTHTEEAFPPTQQALPSWPTQPTLLSSPSPPAIVAAEPQLALLQPPQQAVLSVVPVVEAEVKGEKSKPN